jgi:iturin family lipopeptide synthetase B
MLKNKISSLKRMFCSGEELSQSVVAEFYGLNKELGNNAEVINLYGPTEATVDVSCFNCPVDYNEAIPIGKPIDNTEIYIVDTENNILPPNTEGELVISGVNLARGYLNRDELNREKFIFIDVFGTSKRVYKTGDLAYYNDEGEIIYRGRIDNQIKLRGFRIELSEIENTVLKDNNVAECACLVQDEKKETAHIVCFIVPKGDDVIDTNELKAFIASKLPDYMIPSIVYAVDQMPLTINGKLDRAKLLTMIGQQSKTQTKEVQDQSSIENVLVNLWSKLLNRPDISLTTNFFDLGGNSLLIAQLSILIKKELNMDVSLIIIIQYPTIRLLADYLSGRLDS